MIPKCPICNKDAELVYGSIIYPKRKDLRELPFYRCSDHLDYYVGCHKGTIKSLGVLANLEHRHLKRLCHWYFDPLWKNKLIKRNQAYKVLSEKTGITREECHFGMMNIEQLKKCLAILKEGLLSDL
jgi:hypothetical protein